MSATLDSTPESDASVLLITSSGANVSGRDVSSLCEQLVDGRVGVGDALILEFFEPTHLWDLTRQGELGVDEADVVEAELAECVPQPGFPVVPALTGRSRPVAATTRGRERQGPAAEEAAAAWFHRQALHDD